MDRPNKPSSISAPRNDPQAQVDASSDRITAKLPSGDSCEISLHGATVISWKSGGRENIWLSENAVMDGSKAIRGGVPVCFPNFGPPSNDATSKLPQHGFARISKWDYLGKSSSDVEGDSVKLDFGLGPSNLSDDSRKAWAYDFGLVYSVTLGKGTLQTMLTVRNEGKEAFEFQMLLHTYFKVKDITTTTVAGLMGVSYIDKVLNATEHTESNTDIHISSEVDRVYRSIPQDTTTIKANGKPYIDVTRDNLPDTVVWNPWIAKSKTMSDFQPQDGYKTMVCVEVGSVNGWQKLEAGDSFEAGMIAKAHI